ncbi:MAG: hypothetical protein QXJ62_06030 [Nitrososphaeria archaeon]
MNWARKGFPSEKYLRELIWEEGLSTTSLRETCRLSIIRFLKDDRKKKIGFYILLAPNPRVGLVDSFQPRCICWTGEKNCFN